MANRFWLCLILFEVANDPSTEASLTGEYVLQELSGYIDTDLAEVEVDDTKAELRFVTTIAEEQILRICDDVKKTLERSHHGRVIYKLLAMDL